MTRHKKTRWISVVDIANQERRYINCSRWATYAKRQANKQARANARYDIAEELEDSTFGLFI